MSLRRSTLSTLSWTHGSWNLSSKIIVERLQPYNQQQTDVIWQCPPKNALGRPFGAEVCQYEKTTKDTSHLIILVC